MTSLQKLKQLKQDVLKQWPTIVVSLNEWNSKLWSVFAKEIWTRRMSHCTNEFFYFKTSLKFLVMNDEIALDYDKFLNQLNKKIKLNKENI